jgi:hypothetical protein
VPTVTCEKAAIASLPSGCRFNRCREQYYLPRACGQNRSSFALKR